MNCQNCGKENEVNANFCGYCGTKIDKKIKPKVTIKKPQVKKETPRKTKVIVCLIILFLILVITFLFYGFNKYNMTNIARGYFVASIEKDADKLYKYLNVENNGFTSKKIFKEVYETDEEVEILNYSVVNTKVSDDGLKGMVTIDYVLKNNNRTFTEKIDLVKSKKNKLIIFENWQISEESSLIVEDNDIKVPKNTQIKLEGIKLNKKHLVKNKENYTLYQVPQMFKGEYEANVTLGNGMELEGNLKVTSIGINRLKDLEVSDEDGLEKNIIKYINLIYESGIDNKNFDEIRKEFDYDKANLKDLKNAYNTFKNNLSDSLKKFNVEEIDIKSTEITDDGYLEVVVDIDYKYTVEYNFFGNHEKKNKDGNDLMNLTFDYNKNEFKLIDMSSLTTHFSKY